MVENDTMESLFPYFDYLQARNIEIEKSHAISIYFDSSEVITMLQGIVSFYDRTPTNPISAKEFSKKEFDSSKTFICSLAIRRLLGTIYLLPTHQAEFYTAFKTDALKDRYDKKELINVFNTSLGIELPAVKSDRISLTKSKFDKIFKDSNKLFKYLNFAYEPIISNRISKFLVENKNKVIKFQEYDKESYHIEDAGVFSKIYDAWNSIRPSAKQNNFYDSLAIIRLIELVRYYNEDQNNTIPVFFDAAGSYNKVIQKAKIEDMLILKYEYNSEIYSYSAIRTFEYFEVYSLLEARKGDDLSVGNYKLIINEHEKNVNVLLSAIIGLKQSDNYKNEQNKLNDSIKNYIHLNFLMEVLLPCFTDSIYISLHKFIDLNIQSYTDIGNEIKKLKLIEGEFNNLKNLYNELNQRFAFWNDLKQNSFDLVIAERDEKRLHTSETFNIIEDFSLMRFFIDEKNLDSIKEIFSYNKLLASESKNYDITLIQLFEIYEKSISRDDSKEDDLYKLISTLWILSLYKYTKNIKVKFDSLPTSLLMMLGASYLKDPSFVKKGEIFDNIIKVLEIRVSSTIGEELGKIFLSIAFLKFRLWKSQGSQLISITHIIPTTIDNPALKDAFEKVKKAYELSKKFTDLNAKLYAQNIYLYMIIDCGTAEDFDEIHTDINIFRNERANMRDYWHFRYDDTIARYHHRMSIILQNIDIEQSIKEADKATEEIEVALRGREHKKISDIQEIRDYKAVLQSYMSQLLIDKSIIKGGKG